MSTVILDRTWLTDVVSGDQVGARAIPGADQQHSTAGEDRVYAGGRIRAVTRPGTRGVWTFTLVQLTPAQVGLLRDWLDSSATLYVRDQRGQAMYGVFFELGTTPHPGYPYLYSATVALHHVDVVEGI